MIDYPRPRQDLERVPLTISKKFFDKSQWLLMKENEKKIILRTGFEPVSCYRRS